MGGALALDAAWLFAALLIILVLAAAGIAVRRFLLEHRGGTVECALRRGDGSWRLGVASYQREELCWFGVFGITVRPDEVFPRRDLTVVSRRLPRTEETSTFGPGMIVVECTLGADDGALPETPPGYRGPGSTPDQASIVELAMGEAALTGFLSWLEAAPPSSHLGIALLPPWANTSSPIWPWCTTGASGATPRPAHRESSSS